MYNAPSCVTVQLYELFINCVVVVLLRRFPLRPTDWVRLWPVGDGRLAFLFKLVIWQQVSEAELTASIRSPPTLSMRARIEKVPSQGPGEANRASASAHCVSISTLRLWAAPRSVTDTVSCCYSECEHLTYVEVRVIILTPMYFFFWDVLPAEQNEAWWWMRWWFWIFMQKSSSSCLISDCYLSKRGWGFKLTTLDSSDLMWRLIKTWLLW